MLAEDVGGLVGHDVPEDAAPNPRDHPQDTHENRTIIDTLNIGWELLGMLPREELDRIDTKILDEFYRPASEEATA